jgi:hypothetical protein
MNYLNLFKRTPKLASRSLALSACPCQLPFIRKEPTNDGKLSITVRLTRKNWQRLLTNSDTVERTFVLDALGQEVYEACNGEKQVQVIIKKFAAVHKISYAEAEIAITTFLKTLMTKGLVAMSIERSSHAQAG